MHEDPTTTTTDAADAVHVFPTAEIVSGPVHLDQPSHVSEWAPVTVSVKLTDTPDAMAAKLLLLAEDEQYADVRLWCDLTISQDDGSSLRVERLVTVLVNPDSELVAQLSTN